MPERVDDQCPQHRLGQGFKQGGQEEHGDDRHHPTDQVGHLAAGSRLFFHRGGGHAPGSQHPTEERADNICDRVGVQLLVGVHLVSMLFCKLVRHPQRFAVGHQQNTHRRDQHREVSGEGNDRETKRGSPCGRVPTISTP